MTDEPSKSSPDSDHSDLTSVEFTQLVREHQNAYIRVADQKASILLSGLVAYFGLTLGIIGANIENGQILFLLLAGLSVISALVSIYYAASAVYPNTPPTQQGLIMWESILEMDEDGYRDTVRQKSPDDLLNELIDENYKLAEVNNTKYRQVRRALLAVAPTILFGVLAMITFVLTK